MNGTEFSVTPLFRSSLTPALIKDRRATHPGLDFQGIVIAPGFSRETPFFPPRCAFASPSKGLLITGETVLMRQSEINASVESNGKIRRSFFAETLETGYMKVRGKVKLEKK